VDIKYYVLFPVVLGFGMAEGFKMALIKNEKPAKF
jgi:hypothetical protein